jgi:hypothetical protein
MKGVTSLTATVSGCIAEICRDHRTSFSRNTEPLCSFMAVSGTDTLVVATQQNRRPGWSSGPTSLNRTSDVITVKNSSSARWAVSVMVIWECELRDLQSLTTRLVQIRATASDFNGSGAKQSNLAA